MNRNNQPTNNNRNNNNNNNRNNNGQKQKKKPRGGRKQRGGQVNTFRLAPTNEGPTGRPYTPQVITNRLRRNPQAIADTAAGRRWALRALHPNDESAGGGAPIPDLSLSQSANLEVRHGTIVTAPNDAVTDKSNWDCQFIVLPFPDVALAYRRRKAGNDWSFFYILNPLQNQVTPGSFIHEDDTHGFEPGTLPALSESTTSTRQSFRGLTVELNANSISDQGYMTAGQWGAKPSMVPLVPSTKNGSQITAEIDHYVVESIPGEPDQIIRQCPEAGQWTARQGVYIPCYPTDPTHPYESTGVNVVNNSGDAIVSMGKPVLLRGNNADAIQYTPELVYYGTSSTAAATSACFINQNLATVIFSGLDHTANLFLKMRSGVECIPQRESPMAAFTETAPMVDTKALQFVQAMASRIPICYPAKYNSAGLLGALIASKAPAVAGALVNQIRSQMRPVITGIARKGAREALDDI